MKIGEVADKLGMPASTIRYYEKVGLLERQQRESGRRVFNQHALFVLEFVKLAQAAGFSIKEIKALLRAYSDDPSPAGLWRSLAARKRESVRKKMRDLAQIDSVLSELLSCSCESLAECVEKGTARHASKQRTRG